ncbi:hypothetical protein [Winogradskyella endarachnes]|uniref:Uncharacterized protein n=1 Tax=Winogradskyella endarachnes TaxID=2681965 RepID=A0A6L6UAP7_9FLAO|nr:hypothetical protein [Winogradskyella endarachnes]MUU79029.1 hypothetical protein [Winogradskyella endarachnes]
MKHLKRVLFSVTVCIVLSLNFQCASSSAISNKTEASIPFKVKTIAFQEWNAGENKEKTGINIYVPITEKEDHILIDSVYFKNYKGQLVRNYSRYTSVLRHNSVNDTIIEQQQEKPDYPFNLAENECVIRYVDNGKVRYSKFSNLIQKESIYYKDGPPLAYQRRREAMIVSGEESHVALKPTFQPSTTFKVKTISFQEWYAGIKVGGTGMNVFVPIVNKDEHIKIDSVYFRNLKAKLVEDSGRYTAVLKNKSPYYTFKKAEKDPDFPFTLEDNECAISFVENGEVKYIKISDLNEKRGVYYENGPPNIYERDPNRDRISAIKESIIRKHLNFMALKNNYLAKL